jgi:hypothetical protein
MKSAARKILALTLLATYGGVAFLGQGLHFLAPHAGHHHGLEVVRCSIHGDEHWQHDVEQHDHDHHGHSHDQDRESADSDAGCYGECDGLIVTSSECAAESHVCEICAFLFQLKSERTDLAAAVDWQPVAVDFAPLQPPTYQPTVLGPHAPRGPPVSIG